MTLARSITGLLLGQMLVFGACAPSNQPVRVVIGDNRAAPIQVELDERFVYWIEFANAYSAGNGPIRRLPKDAPGTAGVDDIGTGKMLTASQGTVWWVEDNPRLTVSRRDPNGTVSLMFGRDNAAVRGLARNAQSLYLSFVDLTLGAWQLCAIPLDGSAPTVLSSQSVGGMEFGEVTADDSYVYWAAVPPIDQTGTGEIRRTSVAGGVVDTFESEAPIPLRLLGDADNIYWFGTPVIGVLSPDGTLFKKAKTGTPSVSLAAATGLRGLALDEAFLYWSEENRAIMKVPLAGGAPATLVTFDGNVIDLGNLTVDDRDVYWIQSDVGMGSIMRASKH